MSDIGAMKPAELLRRLGRLAARNGWEIEIKDSGSHTKVWLRGRRTVVSRHPDDLKTGTLRGILKQLGITERDL
jgi:mRNA interferase HicA